MIKLVFKKSHVLRKVWIEGLIITMLSPENGNFPIIININKMKMSRDMIPKGFEELTYVLPEIKEDKDCVRFIVEDFQSIGWRLIEESYEPDHQQPW